VVAIGVNVMAVPEVAEEEISFAPDVVPIFAVPLLNTGVSVMEVP
jgi:hypothetical protein